MKTDKLNIAGKVKAKNKLNKGKITSIAFALLVFLMYFSMVATAHKDAAEASRSDYSYRISLGLTPVHSVVGDEQTFYFRVEDYLEDAPVSDLKARFIIYKDISSDLKGSEELYARSPKDRIGNYESFEEEPGIYPAKHTFGEEGSYLLIARLYDKTKKDNNIIKEITQYVHVEPKGPSVFFWAFMGLSVLLGAIIASRSHEF